MISDKQVEAIIIAFYVFTGMITLLMMARAGLFFWLVESYRKHKSKGGKGE